jgi:hypothetical protein
MKENSIHQTEGIIQCGIILTAMDEEGNTTSKDKE